MKNNYNEMILDNFIPKGYEIDEDRDDGKIFYHDFEESSICFHVRKKLKSFNEYLIEYFEYNKDYLFKEININISDVMKEFEDNNLGAINYEIRFGLFSFIISDLELDFVNVLNLYKVSETYKRIYNIFPENFIESIMDFRNRTNCRKAYYYVNI